MNNQIKTVVLFGMLVAAAAGAGALIAPGAWWAFAVVGLAINFAMYFWSDRLVLRMSGARQVRPGELREVRGIVDELTTRAGMPSPRLYLIDDPRPNAFATGRGPSNAAVAVTSGLLERLTTREVRGVLAHELAHVQSRDVLLSTAAAALAGIVTSAAHMGALLFATRDEEESPGAAGILLALAAPIAVPLVQLAISRSREYAADERGARLSGDPDALADALLRIERASQALPETESQPALASLYIANPLAAAEGMLHLFSTHPPVSERVRRLREMGRPLRPVRLAA